MKDKKKGRISAIIMYAFAALFLFYEMAVQVSPSVMIHELMRDFSISASTLGFVSSVYFVSYAGMQIPAGLFFDHYGPRTLLTIAAVICAVGTLFFAETNTLLFASIGRLLMGVGSAFAFIGVLVVAARWFDGYYFALLVGLTQFLASFGAVAGEMPLAYAVEHFGWRASMNWLGIFGIVIAVLSSIILRDRPEKMHSERMKPEHSLRKHVHMILAKGQTWAAAAYAFTGWGPVVIFGALWGVPFLMLKYGTTNSWAAMGTSMMWIGGGVVSPFIGYISNRMGKRKPLLWMGGVLGFISSILLFYVPNVPFFVACILLVLMGIASACHIITFALVRDINKPTTEATAMGLNNMAVVIGGAVLQPFAGKLLTIFWEGGRDASGVAIYTLVGYEKSLIIIPMLYLIALLICLFCIKETNCHTPSK